MKEVIEKLNKLIEDPEYRFGWVSNIAMSFVDEMEKEGVHSSNPDNHSILVTREMLYKISNKAAENFINGLKNK